MAEERSEGKQAVNVEAVEELLNNLQDVLNARVVVNEWGGIEEVHVLAAQGRAPKQLVRDIESSLAARWGIAVDHKKISVAVLDEASADLFPERIRLLNVTRATDGAELSHTVTVELGYPGVAAPIYAGSASGHLSLQPAHRLAGQAMAAALHQAVGAGHAIIFEDAREVSLGDHAVMVALISFAYPDGRGERLAGSALLNHDPLDAVVRACLSAVNRRLGRVRKHRPE